MYLHRIAYRYSASLIKMMIRPSAMLSYFLVSFGLFATVANVAAFVSSSSSSSTTKPSSSSPTTALSAISSNRRGFLAAAAAVSFLAQQQPAFAEQATEYRQGIEVSAFNGLIFNYRGGEYGGLDASMLNEPSVSYTEFNEKLKAGEVEFVEFMAPDGDAAYVTFKPKEGESKAPSPIRIGEGYPIEQHDGYSSPMFCVRAVKNAGVPYKFTVPGLAKFKS